MHMRRVESIRGFLFASIFSLLAVLNLESQENDKELEMLIVSFPLQGIYITPNTPGSKVPSHGTAGFGEEYAIDFVMVQENGLIKKSYRKSFFEYLFKGLDLTDFYGWGQTIYSPVSGTVIETEDGIEERNPVNILADYTNTVKVTKDFIEHGAPSNAITGNYVMIKTDQNVYALLAHLKNGSIKVKAGQTIGVHDEIGQLGHSGNSTMPHLHMQFMNSKDYRVAQGIPFVFESYEVKQNYEWVRMHNALPKAKEIIRYQNRHAPGQAARDADH